ncbi:MAG: GAF domain-containing protein [Anaerolineales bacterium]|nr:GAF domain-containing protein [Anaerolineales bacterium]
MLSYRIMKQPFIHNLNAFSSGILGVIGAALLLIPAELRVINTSEFRWLFAVLGFVSFATALSLEVVSIIRAGRKRSIIIRGAAAALLFIFTRIYWQAGYYLEGIILFYTGLATLTLLTPLKKYFTQTNILNLTFVLIGFTSGIFLAVSKAQYAQYDLVNYKTSLVIGFLVTALAGGIATVAPSLKHSGFLMRLQILPWLGWCLIFIPIVPIATLLIPFLAIMAMIMNDIVPWDYLDLTKDNILGYRSVMIAASLELILLTFLGVLLLLLDISINETAVSIATIRGVTFLFFFMASVIIHYEVFTILMTINILLQELKKTEDVGDPASSRSFDFGNWGQQISLYLRPFILTQELTRIRINAQTDQIDSLAHQVGNEKKRNAQLNLLLELSQQLENQLDQPVAAQLAANTLERALECSLACIYVNESENREFMLLAAAGHQTNMIPAGYRQSISVGAIGRAIRQRKTQIINDIREDADYIRFENENSLSSLIIPLILNGHANGAIVLSSEKTSAFSSIDIGLAEAVGAELTRSWERSGYHQRLMNLIQAGSQLSAMVEPGTTAHEVASISREILQARFTFVHIQLGQERNFTQSASSGPAPNLLRSLQNSATSESLVLMAFQAAQPFRIRDVRKYSATSHLDIDNAGLRSMLTIPIRWHRMNIGVIFAFGKQDGVFFSENDESLAELLSIQAAGAFESTWLQQELRSSLRITSLLYRLSNQIIQAENLESAAVDIAKTAHKLAKSITTGIVLLNVDGEIEAELEIDETGTHSGNKHPMELIKDAMNSGQLIYFSQGHSVTRTCLPIQTPIRKYGAVWMDAHEDQGNKPAANPNDLQALVNQAAIALERSLLLVESRRQAVEIKAAYDMLEATYDQTLASLISALDARDRETEGHSLRVSSMAAKLGETLGYTHQQLKVLERGSLLHDIGKIGISDTILHKPGPLTAEEWKIMKLHPDIGAKIVEGIPFLQDTIPLIRHHQERWDGTGYPSGLAGEDIPILARMFSIVDAFDALTSNRPYRTKISTEEALQYLNEQSGILFDPNIVPIFEQLVLKDETGFVFSD